MQHPLRRLLSYARPHKRDIVLASLFSVINKIFDILPEVLIGALVDTVVQKETSLVAKLGIVKVEHQIIALAVATVIIWGSESLFEYLYALRWRNLAQTIQHELRQDVYGHVQKLPMSFFEERSSGQVLAVLNDDINQLERFLNGGANDLIQVCVSSVAVSAIFFVLTPSVAVIAVLPVPLILLGAFYFQRKLEPHYADVRQRAAVLNGVLSNNLTGMSTIKAYVAEDHESQVIRQLSQEYRSANQGAIRISSAITPVIRVAVLAGFVSTLVYGGFLTLSGTLAVGAYSVLVFLTQRLLWPFTRLADMTDLYQRSMASTKRALDLLETPLPIRDGDQHLEQTPSGELALQGVTLRYGDFPALSEVDLTVAAGTTTALVGTTGSGKSSIVKLLLRFYDPSAGAITIDGVDTKRLTLAELRQSIGLVSQDALLIDGTVADNIAYGTFDAAKARIEAAAVAAEADEFVRALPNGYDTRVGERGQKLSGGQRQRIALARAILKDPPILILDEATSAVDNETEAAIKRSLATVTKGRTTVIIAHRLSTIRHADQICVLEAGVIVERGTHDELLEAGGRYAALWEIQTGAVAA